LKQIPQFESLISHIPDLNRGLIRYAARRDKSYSLTDCISMNVMEAEGIQAVLTNDRHFLQEGFTALIQ